MRDRTQQATCAAQPPQMPGKRRAHLGNLLSRVHAPPGPKRALLPVWPR